MNRATRCFLFTSLILAACGLASAQTDETKPAPPADQAPGTQNDAAQNPDTQNADEGLPLDDTITNSLDMKLVLVQPGEFNMGSDDSLADVEQTFGKLPDNFKPEMFDAEHPRHKVKITQPFYLGAYEVTKAQFRRFVEAERYKSQAESDGQGCSGWNATGDQMEWKREYTWADWGTKQGDDHPVVNVSWNDAVAFCAWLSANEGAIYRLPTEAEWEYACRAGTTTQFYNGDDPELLVKIGNVPDGTLSARFPVRSFSVKACDGYVFTSPVGRFEANAFGLFDMTGGASEWCSDGYDAEYYGKSPPADPPGADGGEFRVVRGGGWDYFPADCRSARRVAVQPDYRNPTIGFRVVLDVAEGSIPVSAEVAADPPDDKPRVETTTGALGMKLALIPAGEFTMGSDEDLDELEAAFKLRGGVPIALNKLEDDPDAAFDNADFQNAIMERMAGFPEFATPKDYAAEHPAHQVKITKPFYLGLYEVTKAQFREFVAATDYQTDAEKSGKGGWDWVQEAETLLQKPPFNWRTWEGEQGGDHPVVNVSFNDATAFCAWLSAQDGRTYRLPTEAEWEYACRGGTDTRFFNGDEPERLVTIGNVRGFRLHRYFEKLQGNITITRHKPKAKDGYIFTAPVGRFRRNPFGLYDMTGNVSEWCSDWFDAKYYAASPAEDPSGPAEGVARVIRGGGWDSGAIRCRSAFRHGASPAECYGSIGFRVVMEVEPRKIETITNTVGMKLARVPAGQFTMGSESSLGELQATLTTPDFVEQRRLAAEHPAHLVKITKPFFMGVYEVTRAEFQKFVEADGYETEAEKDGKGGFGLDEKSGKIAQRPDFNWRTWGYKQTDDRPVVNVTWNDAAAFCAWLSAQEGQTYRLPTEAEWEFACRGGTDTLFYNGDDPQALAEIGNVPDATFKRAFTSASFAIEAKDVFVLTAPVGKFQPNGFGLYDMTGNVSEWCSDWFGVDYYYSSPLDDPTGPSKGSGRVIRGGGWSYYPVLCRSCARMSDAPTFRRIYTGFRVVREE